MNATCVAGNRQVEEKKATFIPAVATDTAHRVIVNKFSREDDFNFNVTDCYI